LYNASSYTDEELLFELSQDDRGAFAEIYRRYWSLLLALAYNRLKDLQSAEDIVHDVFTCIWHNRHRQEIKILKNYLATAVKYLVLREIRKKAHYQLYQESEPIYLAQENFSDEIFDTKHILVMLQQEIETLPEKCRLIFKLSREVGMSIKQIAKEMDIAPKTVENQLNKALRRLRGTLKKHSLHLFSFLF
jgi:RNA polymerase sigma-70 factor (family 1)